jgi:DNA invertase Pin-like site-specific DNA recombinase
MSLADQRREIERYAERHGYRILRWFEDDAISGDATEKRAAFQTLHKAACNGKDFEVILCWDQDRFGRFDSTEAGYWICPLRRAGVRLVTVTEGPADWNSFTGRVMYGLKQEAKHSFLVDLSRNTARGQITNAMKGYLCGQAAPYGYDRMLVDEAGNHRQRVHNGEKFAKPRSWHVTLVPSDDPEKVATAKWLFYTYANESMGLRQLCDSLNARGIPGPGGGTWWVGTVREILKNEAYTGDFFWAKRRMGKYHRVAGGDIKGRDGDTSVKRNPREEWIGRNDAHEALIDRKTWERVQAKLTARRSQTASHKATNKDCYVLTGILYCGHCGAKMYGARRSRKKGGKTYVQYKYVCSAYHTQGKQVCGHHSVEQAPLVNYLTRRIQELVLGNCGREDLVARIRQHFEARRAADPAQVAALQTRIDQLEKDIEHGTKRLLRAPDDVADLLARELSGIRRERDRLSGELAELEQQRPDDVENAAKETADGLWKLAESLQQAKPTKLREVLSRIIARIDLTFGRKEKSTRVECPFSNGVMYLRPDSLLTSLVSRGDWI